MSLDIREFLLHIETVHGGDSVTNANPFIHTVQLRGLHQVVWTTQTHLPIFPPFTDIILHYACIIGTLVSFRDALCFLLGCPSLENYTMWTLEEPSIWQWPKIRVDIVSRPETIRCWHLVADIECPSLVKNRGQLISRWRITSPVVMFVLT